MSDHEMAPNDAPSQEMSELSDEELDEVAGGLSIRFTLAQFQQSKVAFAQETPLGGCGPSRSAFQSENTASSFLELTILDATTEDIQALGGLFGGNAAIEGSE
ncbi:CTB family bacteriocin [Phormidesmis sp. 146-35]